VEAWAGLKSVERKHDRTVLCLLMTCNLVRIRHRIPAA
jgi:hypothetical protein